MARLTRPSRVAAGVRASQTSGLFDVDLEMKPVALTPARRPVFRFLSFLPLFCLLSLPCAMAYTKWNLIQKITRFGFWLVFKTLYRVRIRGLENIPTEGGVVLVFNHSCWLDGAIILTLIPRRLRPVAWGGNFKNWALHWWAKFCGVILMMSGPKSIRAGLKEASETLRQGGMIGIFPEGGISRSGQIRTFRPGVMKIMEGIDVPVLPCYIDEVWGSIFSYSGGKAFFKWPNSFRRPLTLNIGKPMRNPETVFEIQQAEQVLSADSVEYRIGRFKSPAERLIKQCKKRLFKEKIADSTGQSVTGGALLMRLLIVRRLLRKFVLSADESTVGVLLPPSNGGVIVNAALSVDRRTVVNLNYSLSADLINFCIKEAGITHVLTTQKVLDKFGFELDCEVILLEGLRDKVSLVDKMVAVFQSYILPISILKRALGLSRISPDDLMTIVFTSGSTGTPKGVMLTQENIGTNMDGIERCASFKSTDAMIGILPFFHSFGYTATLWAAVGCNLRGIYHFSPLDARQVGKLVARFKGTILVATPTFLRSYLRRCSQEEFASLDVVVAGAERLPPELTEQFDEKFGVRPVEGYGATELSPIVAVNIPGSRTTDKFQIDQKEGTVGRPIPNCTAKVLDLDTGEQLGPDQSGMLWITGPNVMKGYLNRKDLTDEVIVNGWYKTGDVALVDSDGFIKITGRISRFSKIGGEMVPHLKVEEILTKHSDPTPDDASDNDEPNIAVTSIADPKKGERLIVLHTRIPKTPEELRTILSEEGLPNIFIPSKDSFREVDTLPMLGSGKLDLKQLKLMAESLYSGESL
ncbi:MAG: AMP-binding protein [Mariniblastus sp.]|nr:AMP-binding protein [Mariniblastus sp.]